MCCSFFDIYDSNISISSKYIEKGKVSILQNGKISINFFLQKK